MTELERRTRRIPNDVVVKMVPMIDRIARRMLRRLPPTVCLDDLTAAGFIGLLNAYARLDPARADGFEAYAEFCIRGAMLDELRAYDPLSRDQRAEATRITKATCALHGRLGRPPKDDEIAAELGISLEYYWVQASAVASSSVVSLDGGPEGEWAVQVRDPRAEDACERLSRERTKAAVEAAIRALPARLRQVIELHFRDGMTLREIGALLGITESRVCQLCSEAVACLRARCAEHAEDESESRPAPRSRRRRTVRSEHARTEPEVGRIVA